MSKRKLHALKRLRKELLSSFGKRFPASVSATLPWQILEKSIQDQTHIDGTLRASLQEVASNRSVEGYFELQKFNDPQLYGSWTEYKSVASVLSLLKKFPFGKVANLDPEGVAKARSEEAEKLCRITNKRLSWYRFRGYRHKNRWQGLHSVLHTARLMISGWLGPLDLNKIYDYTRHGPGGAIGVTGDETTAYFKYAAANYSVTTRALPYAMAAILADPLWRRYIHSPDAILGDVVPSPDECRQSVRSRLRVVDYNKVTYVPKTAQTHRAIAIEPLMNIFLQLGVGNYLRDNLRRIGLNLRSQARNQNLANLGSDWKGPADLRPVTLDLSMASDTLSFELVRELLPEEWFNFLTDLRSEFGLKEGKEIPWAKFSSMGNGFTFQLESMIFYALSLSVAKHLGFGRELISVYGDDIICPSGMALRLLDTLAYAGFKVNYSKSYFFGPFRESCGTDWFEGRNVRPFFLKRKIKNAKDLVFVLNSHGGIYTGFDPDIHDSNVDGYNTVRYLYNRLPKIVQDNLLGPRVEDMEGHVHSPWDIAQKSALVLWRRETQTWTYASVKAYPVIRDGQVGPLFLQLMGSNSGRKLAVHWDANEVVPVDNNGEANLVSNSSHSLRALEVKGWISTLRNSGAVSMRNRTRLALATQASTGWRND
jgi:hypothetical protein